MPTLTGITIDEYGQLRFPLEVSQILNLKNNEMLKVKIQSDHLVLIPQKAGTDEEILDEMLKVIIHEGILIDIK
ncbi:hypothetical protein Dred_1764 [Desulforamulus reducens MI-1]|uniref:SpoVT-AbrB domain-containing protein n=1 Tax=Desulforamulus reducens (strain ATCC BAA-1160 / DSM 100696 / MI-1) TaxID=349161 RepID=A4J5D6_DESRM|nr:hypothetical protein [Desulforamulus reducens]ABO50289.1 hypothetical protein Dred_1764 [Desulforamulus reducens MI-1]